MGNDNPYRFWASTRDGQTHAFYKPNMEAPFIEALCGHMIQPRLVIQRATATIEPDCSKLLVEAVKDVGMRTPP